MIASSLTRNYRSEFECCLCKHFMFPFIKLCPDQIIPSPNIYTSSASSHYACLTCFSTLLSHDPDTNQAKLCPLCKKEHGAKIVFGDDHSIRIEGKQSLMISRSLQRLVFGEKKYPCGTCSHFEGTFSELTRHYFERCEGFAFYCCHCSSHKVTRKSFESHHPLNCAHVPCEHKNCSFLLFPRNNQDIEAKLLKRKHEKRHKICNDLKILSNKIAFAIPLLHHLERQSSFVIESEILLDSAMDEISGMQEIVLSSMDELEVHDAKGLINRYSGTVQFILNVLRA